MIDLQGLKVPENAPEPGACLRVEHPEPGLTVVYLAPPHRRLAVFDAPLIRDLDALVTQLEADPNLRAVVITGRDATQFAAGADVDAIAEIEDPKVVERIVLAVHALFRRIEKLSAHTVCAIGGPAPGGAYELALACNTIVASDDPRTKIGLPETMLGIVPGWGGSHRLPRRIGIPMALDVILAGKVLPAKVCWKRGMIDRLTKPEYLVRVASEIAMGRLKVARQERGSMRWLVDRNPLAKALIKRQATKQVLAKTRGHYPAPLAALELVLEAPGVSLEQGAAKEAKAISELAVGPVAKSLISIFFASEEAKKLGKPEGLELRKLERATVLGAGVMGAGIASVMALKQIAVRLSDLSQDALDTALGAHRAAVAKQLSRRRLDRADANAALDRLDGTCGLVGLGRSQIVVEAIAEKLEIKRAVFTQLAELVDDDCILATNTSSLSVTAIAEGLPHPARICGMHFFNPVPAMPLVEVIRGEHTSERTISEVCALALALGKTPLVCKDVAGFLVNRLLGPYLDEAVRLFVAGADPAHLDRSLVDFGLPMGPLTLLDEVGLDIAQHAAASLFEAYGERMQPSTGLDTLSNKERLGKKTGLGFYRHESGRAAQPASDLASFQKEDFARSFSAAEIVDRCILAMVNEAARCLEEQVVAGPVELDLGTVFGTGFAPFRGGLLRYADSLGLDKVVERLEAIASAPDVAGRPGGSQKFRPADLLARLASEGKTFHELEARPASGASPRKAAG